MNLGLECSSDSEMFLYFSLPVPDELVYKEDNVKVTLNLSRSSVEFFKKIAKKHGSQYQRVIRKLLDSYTSHYSG